MIFGFLRNPLVLLPNFFITLPQSLVSLKRINKFLNCEELSEDNVQHDERERDVINIRNGTFSWKKLADKPVLQQINLEVKQGSLVAVVGALGVGKSSLLAAILGEMEKITGEINIRGSVAYVPQQAWIQNATIRDNIVFGRCFDQTAYKRVLKACALDHDLSLLPGGDGAEIGDQGVNLSGGQKHRVSMARAVYSDSDLYLLDNPLSAFDPLVGKHIFDNVIGSEGLLKNKTRILTTNSHTYLQQMDLIVVLNEGRIADCGTYQELNAREGAFRDFLKKNQKDHLGRVDELIPEPENSTVELHEVNSSLTHSLQRGSSDLQPLLSAGKLDLEEEGKFVLEEKFLTGRVKLSVYKDYLKSLGLCVVVLVSLLHILNGSIITAMFYHLSKWPRDNSTMHQDTEVVSEVNLQYLSHYAVWGVICGIVAFCVETLIRLSFLVSSSNQHKSMLHGVLNAPLLFLDSNPCGRVIARFSRDIDILDHVLPIRFHFFLSSISWSILPFISIIYLFGAYGFIFVLAIVIIYMLLSWFYIATSRQVRRLESISRSPIYSRLNETYSGAASIRAFGVRERFTAEFDDKVDLNQRCNYSSNAALMWLNVWLEMLCNVVVLVVTLFAIIHRKNAAKETLTEGLLGSAILFSMQMVVYLKSSVLHFSEIETNIVAVERTKEYSDTTAEEKNEAGLKLLHTWPKEGKLEFRDFQTRYRKGQNLVLSDIKFVIKPAEKIGVVGRTGAGKSSLALALFRILEAETGDILIDNVDISELALSDLRSRLTIIPQDPVLFSGSLRMNLDPVGSQKDADLLQALNEAHLSQFLFQQNGGLEFEIVDEGRNLSVGQRQLICLGRALLRKTNVLVLDEATAAVDLETDNLIQQTIRSHFNDCTVLTIAHRLHTVMNLDRIMVIHNGKIMEFDTPNNLLANHQSIFFRMAQNANIM